MQDSMSLDNREQLLTFHQMIFRERFTGGTGAKSFYLTILCISINYSC